MRIVLTGGSRGIGRMMAEHLHPSNDVVIISKSKASVRKTAEETGISGYAADVTDYDAVEMTLKEIGPFDALINCAGILGPVGAIQNTDTCLWKQTIKTNLLGTVYCCKAAIPLLQNGRRGKIINLSGGGSAFPRVYHSAYACSKAAVVRFSENLAWDLKKDNIKIDVNVIAPGAHKTDLWRMETLEKEPDCWADRGLLMKLADYLLSEKSDGVSGRFLNIKDDYAHLDESISDSDLYTLRRIDNYRYRRMG